MNNLAQMAFDYAWMALFADEDVIDLDYSVKLLEALSLTFAEFTPAEQDAFADVGRQTKSRLLAEPDEYGYTPRDLVTDEQRKFLDAVIDKDIYNRDWWSS